MKKPITAIGNVSRVMAVRLQPGMDVLLGLEEACRDNGISNGVIVSAIGGVTTAVICDPLFFPDRKQPYNYGDPIVLKEPLCISGLSGLICHDDSGKLNLHVHISLSDSNGKAYAGHLKEGSITMQTVDAVIAEIGGLSMIRKYDPELEVPVFSPEQR